MDFYRLVLGALCVWRITHLLQAEDGPWNLVVRLRRKAGTGFWAHLLDCFYCLSLWVALPFAYLFGRQWDEQLLLWPALSAGAILLERITTKGSGVQPALYFEEEEMENENVVLRQAETTIPADGSDVSNQ